jgi:hypothetical protein
MLSTRLLRLLLVTGLILLTLGCGGSNGSVRGKVVHKDKTVVVGTVMLKGSDGNIVSAVIDQDGTFRFDSVASGKYKVGVASTDPATEIAAVSVNQRMKVDPKEKKAAPTDTKGWFKLPPNADNPENSGLTLEVKPGKNDVTITIP